jgi:hypothetical protein
MNGLTRQWVRMVALTTARDWQRIGDGATGAAIAVGVVLASIIVRRVMGGGM